MITLLLPIAAAWTPALAARSRLAPRSPQPTLCVAPEPFAVELTLDNGVTDLVTLDSEASVVEAAETIAEKHGLDADAALDVEVELWNRWYQAADEAAPVYSGASPAGGALAEPVASLELPEHGLALEVGPSLLPGAGDGLFVRCTDAEREVALEIGTAVCGYAAGAMRAAPDARGKAVGFALNSLDASVWFERELISVGELLERPDVGWG